MAGPGADGRRNAPKDGVARTLLVVAHLLVDGASGVHPKNPREALGMHSPSVVHAHRGDAAL
eukprot:9114502-Heterocapsa_arctica.AAC.1